MKTTMVASRAPTLILRCASSFLLVCQVFFLTGALVIGAKGPAAAGGFWPVFAEQKVCGAVSFGRNNRRVQQPRPQGVTAVVVVNLVFF